MISLEKPNTTMQSIAAPAPGMTPPAGTVSGVTPAPTFTYIDCRPAKKQFAASPHDSVFAWVSMALGFLFVRYTFTCADGFVTTASFILLHLFCVLYLKKSGCRLLLPQRILSLVIYAVGMMFSLSASPVLHGMCFWFLLFAQAWQVTAAGCGIPFVSRYFLQDACSAVLKEPFSNMGAAPSGISASVKKSGTASAVKSVVIGLLVTVPLTIIVAALLAGADSNIERLLNGLLELVTDNVMRTVIEVAVGIPVGFWLFGMVYGGAHRRENPFPSDAVRAANFADLRMIPNLALYSGVTPICLLYVAYFLSQMNYFVSAFFGRLPGDMIYSEYARRGFFELCGIAVINLIVILVLTGCAKKHPAKALTVYACALCGFTLFIIATALAKMFMYISAYGLTSLRLYTAWFMVLLAVVFLVLAVRQFVQIPTSAVLAAAFTGMFLVLCFARPDALIARYNITRYENGTLSELDINALSNLSEDAYAVMAQHKDTILNANEAANDCYKWRVERFKSYYEDHPESAWNLPAQYVLKKG